MTSQARTVDKWFSYISNCRAEGTSWAEIERDLARKGDFISRGYLKTLYEKELKRRTSPERRATMRWLYENYGKISDLLERKVSWDVVIALVPPPEEMADPLMRFSDLIADFSQITQIMAGTKQGKTTKSMGNTGPLTRFLDASFETLESGEKKGRPARTAMIFDSWGDTDQTH